VEVTKSDEGILGEQGVLELLSEQARLGNVAA
jgi:hypothetical protein